jgi:uncharacterized protein DUF4349
VRYVFSVLAVIALSVGVAGCSSSGAMASQERKADSWTYGGDGGGYEGEASSDEELPNQAPGLMDGALADRGRGDLLEVDDDQEPVRPTKGKRPGETAVEPGRSTPLLIYTAHLDVAVYQVQSTQKKVISLAKALGGFLARQDGQVVVIRVPARRFEAALDRIEGFGDVIRRQIEAKDVTEEFRDQTIRLRNLEAVRARLETLLEKADKVKDALEVQRELARITGQIESLKGRLRFLEDRIAFSTISVNFQPRPQNDAASAAPAAFHLPFPWIEDLGLRSLMDVR